jgi:quercetin 2,3-dioxygenase
VARGEIVVNGRALGAGDAAGLDRETQLRLSQGRAAEVLVLVDLSRK